MWWVWVSYYCWVKYGKGGSSGSTCSLHWCAVVGVYHYCWVVVKVLPFHWASSDTTAVGGGRRCWVEAKIHVPHMVSTDTTRSGAPLLLPGVKIPAPCLVFSDHTILVELGHLAMDGQGRSLGFWLGLGWHEGRGAQFFLWCCWLLLTNIEQYYLKVFYLAKCPFLWLQKADFVKKKIFFFGCSHQCFWVISFIGTQSRIDETKRKHRLATASFLGFEVLTDLHLSESSSIFFYM